MVDHNLLLTLETVPHELRQSKDVQKRKEGGERKETPTFGALPATQRGTFSGIC